MTQPALRKRRRTSKSFAPGDEALHRKYVMELGLGTDTALRLWALVRAAPGITARALAAHLGSKECYVRAYLREMRTFGILSNDATYGRGRPGRWYALGETPDPAQRLPGMYASRIPKVTAVLEEQDEPLTTAALAKAVGCLAATLERTLAAMTERGEITHCGTDDQGRDLWA